MSEAGRIRRRRVRLAQVLVAVPATLLVALVLVSPVSAVNYVVNSLDGDLDGVCDAANCTIRDAVVAANANPGLDTITFDLPGPAPYIIQPVALIEEITDRVVIDGTSQPGFDPAVSQLDSGLSSIPQPVIVLDGEDALEFAFGLRAGSDGSTIKGFAIHGFEYGIAVEDSNNITIETNYIGTDETGSVAVGNSGYGIHVVDANNTLIGGTSSGAGNVLSANSAGIFLKGTANTDVLGNRVGTDRTGMVDLGNELAGLAVDGGSNTDIGNGMLSGLNVISGNDSIGPPSSGIAVQNTNGMKIRKNYIGVGADGTTDIGNTGSGVYLFADNIDVEIGGSSASDGNTIAHNGLGGVVIAASNERISIQNNSIHSNGELGIDLGADGVTANDANDADVGANNLQNFPVLVTADASAGEVQVTGSLSSIASTPFRIEIFASEAGDPSGNGEGQYPLGSFNVTTDATGLATFDQTLSLADELFNLLPSGMVPLSLGDSTVVTATATDPSGNTSEFSATRAITGALEPTPTPTPTPAPTPAPAPTATPAPSPSPSPNVPVPASLSQFSSIVVTGNLFDPILNHNIPNLNVTHNPSHTANFLDFYSVTGGITRWGLPTSEVFEESPGVLVQYYQRGVVTWKASLNTPGVFTFQRVLAWDFIGGGLGGSVDQGVEPGFFNPNPGTPLGPWGHRVSNTSVEGVGIGFLDFFNSLGGVNSFGYPKTDARADLHPNAVLTRPGSAPAFIRQYFQAAVMEYHPDAPPGFKVKLSLLGDTVRNLKYPGNAWQAIAAFTAAAPLTVGQNLPRPA